MADDGILEGLSPAVREELRLREDALARIRRLLTEELKVPVPPDRIDLDAPLFGTGLGLDSVDAIELVVAVEREFSLLIPQGSVGPWAFRTVGSLVELAVHPPPAVISTAAPTAGGAR